MTRRPQFRMQAPIKTFAVSRQALTEMPLEQAAGPGNGVLLPAETLTGLVLSAMRTVAQACSPERPGRLISSDGQSRTEVVRPASTLYKCALRGHLPQQTQESTKTSAGQRQLLLMAMPRPQDPASGPS